MHLNKILTKEFLIKKLIGEEQPIMLLALEIPCSKKMIIHYCKKHRIYSKLKKIRKLKTVHNDLKGQEFDKLTVLNRGDNDPHGKVRWLCQCSCGRTKLVNAASLTRKLSKSCGYCARSNFTGYKDISGSHWRRIKEQASKRDYKFEITPEYVWYIFEQQDRKCALSGLPVSFVKNQDKGTTQTASIDRIDSKLGYIEGNIQIIHKRINFVKGSFTNDNIVYISKLIYLHHQALADSLHCDVDTMRHKNWS